MAEKKRVVIVVNKYWECDPVCWVLTNEYIKDRCGIDLAFEQSFRNNTYPSYGPVKPAKAEDTVPRMTFETDARIIEIWCISDMLSNSPADLQSSSEEKMKLLPVVFNGNSNIELVVAVGTASAGPSLAMRGDFKTDNINGSVVVGGNVFMHNGWDPDSKSNFACDCWGKLLSSGAADLLGNLQKTDFTPYEQLLLCPPTNPSPLGQHVYVDKNYIALGDVNVTDYRKYTEKDKETGQKFLAAYPGNVNGISLETTHCLIYLSARNHMMGQEPPFVFISGVADRYTMFSADVDPKGYAQNVSGAHNAGVVVAYLISQLVKGSLSSRGESGLSVSSGHRMGVCDAPGIRN